MSLSKLHFVLLFLLVSQILVISDSQTIPKHCHPHDKSVLLRIKNYVGNPSSLASWKPNTDCCTHWLTVQCNDDGHVTKVTFNPTHDIHGPIPPYWDNLPWLTGLYFLNVTNLSGPVPSYIGKLTNLTFFIIMGTKVSGPIPDFLGQFSNLIQLNLPSNKFSGPIPDSLGRLKNLLFLDLTDNRLTGQIPIALTQLKNLADLTLGSNMLSGPIPDFLNQLDNIQAIGLESNYLTGPIPEYLGHIPRLSTLWLFNNQLTGPIPKSLGRSNFAVLNLGQNKLTGDASFLFDNETTLYEVYVGNNLLKFDFSNVDLGQNIVGVNISHNMIYGSLPKRFGKVLLDSFDVSYNELCGPIPNGTLFEQVDPALFTHNKCLCDGPLPACK